MKKEPFALFLVALLFGISTFSLLLAYKYVQSTREVHRLQYHLTSLNRDKARVQALAQEAAEYSRRNPAITSVFQNLNRAPQPTNDFSTGNP